MSSDFYINPYHRDPLGEIQELVQRVREGKLSINAKSPLEETLLMIASREHAYDDVVYLVENGVAVNAVDLAGRTALLEACKTGALKVVTYLIAHTANIDVMDDQSCTPLYYAYLNNHTDVVAHLTAHGGSLSDSLKAKLEHLAAISNLVLYPFAKSADDMCEKAGDDTVHAVVAPENPFCRPRMNSDASRLAVASLSVKQDIPASAEVIPVPKIFSKSLNTAAAAKAPVTSPFVDISATKPSGPTEPERNPFVEVATKAMTVAPNTSAWNPILENPMSSSAATEAVSNPFIKH